MRGGRGYSHRGGGGRGGSSYRGSGSSSYRGSGGRSNFGSSYNSYNNSRSGYNNSYDSRNRDRSNTNTRYDRHNDHKRSYRDSSRDRSDDRKRSRHEDSRMSSSYSSSSYRRNDTSRSSRQTPPPPSVRTSSGPHRRDDSSSHRHSSNNDSMRPPRSMAPRGSRIIRSSRGGGGGPPSHRPSIRSSNVRLIRRGRESTDLRIMRKKLLMANYRDRMRKMKIAKLTSSLLNKQRDPVVQRKTVRKSHDKKDDSKKDGDDDDDADKSKSKQGDDDDDDDEQETVGGEKGDDVKVKKEAKEKRNEGKKDAEADGSDADDAGEKDIDDKDDDEESKHGFRRPRRNFIKLSCPHCRSKCLTFKEYSNHLYSHNHRLAMRRLAMRQKSQLSKMRMNQRNAQRDIEESSKGETDDCKPQYCPLCRLNYRQPKAKHQLSESHRIMKKFLMPYCGTCHIAFKSPMMYETHRCSLEHIKRRARHNESANSDSSDVEKEVDLNNFMTVDSVGEIDGDEAKADGEDAKEKVNVGADHVKKIEALFCDICQVYFSVKDDEETMIRKHCANRSHLKSYRQFTRDEAERLQRKQKETKEKKKKETDEKAAATATAATDGAAKGEKDGENVEENEEGGEDKIWEDVDKDLGDLLREVAPDGDHEDDEEDGSVLDINIERFDKFKNSENQKKDLNGDVAEEVATETKAPEAKESPTKKVEKKSVADAAKTEDQVIEIN